MSNQDPQQQSFAQEIEIPILEEIDGWCTVKIAARREGITVQGLYYRIQTSISDYEVANFGGVIIVRLRKDKFARLNRRLLDDTKEE